ncbi:Alpha/Beta hydrolase protein [Ilyonectria robusta]|uniref:Alpha/Beta hydrolase protein n=1 Tax=Ilyonectria robusta TaxID=1079257 RepID=UPI001E8E31D7|nr:Alpha/Beta hydrolase protein [Ilyonectria robusta]KAH8651791.1 Alpha/Beta hydrolase protein [Ilyonectria robusta]
MSALAPDAIEVDLESPRFRDVRDTIAIPVLTQEFSAYWLRRRHAKPPAEAAIQTKTLLWIHGGGYCMGTPFWMFSTLFRLTELMSNRHVYLDILSIDYTLAPKAVLPHQQNEAVAAYRYLIEKEKISPDHIIVGGESAGGHLAVACLLGIALQRLPRPAASILLCPWVNLTNTGASFERNKNLDFTDKPRLDAAAALVLGWPDNHTGDDLANLSAREGRGWRWGDVLPARTWVNVGTYDLFFDDIVAFCDNAVAEGAKLEFEASKEKTHGWQARADHEASESYYQLEPNEEVPEGMLPGSVNVASGLLKVLKIE